MTKCEVNDVTLSDSDSDGDFIQAKKVIHPFLYQVSVVHQVSITSSSYYNLQIVSQDLSTYIVMDCSLAKSDSFALPEDGSFASR